MPTNSGIYKITCLANGRYYYGSTSNFSFRWKDHKYRLRHKKHPNPHLQRCWNKYGPDSFKFEIVDTTPINNLLKEEQIYLDKHIGIKECMNIALQAGGGGFSEETRNKISESLKGENNPNYGKPAWNRNKKLSKETRKKMSESTKGRIPWNKGKKMSEEARKNMSKAAKRRKKISS